MKQCVGVGVGVVVVVVLVFVLVFVLVLVVATKLIVACCGPKKPSNRLCCPIFLRPSK